MKSLLASLSCLVLLLSSLACEGSAPVANGTGGGDGGERTSPLPGLRDGGAFWTVGADAGAATSSPAVDGGGATSGGAEDAGAPEHDAGAGAADGGGQAPRDGGDGIIHDAGASLEVDAGSSLEVDAGGASSDGLDGGGLDDAGHVGPDAGPNHPPGARRGEPCFPAGGTFCGEELVCAPVYEGGPGVCEYPCTTPGQACASGGSCVDFTMDGDALFACASAVGQGDACDPEALQVCADGSLCLEDTLSSRGSTCRMPCACAAGATCDASACGTSECVVLDRESGLGFCGTAVGIGDSCSPIHEARLCAGTASGDAACASSPEAPETGICRHRCETSAECGSEALCLGAPDGLCWPTTGLSPGALCTLPLSNPTQPFVCGEGLDCVRLHADLPAGLGTCLKACQSGGDCAAGSDCFALPTLPEAGNRCLRELPRGARGCNPPEPLCAGDAGRCVQNPAGDTQCKLGCDVAACPGPACPCDVGETCVTGMLEGATEGLCGTLAGLDDACDESRDIYCEKAPGEDDLANAFAWCAGRCVMLCRYEMPGEPAIELSCPSGYTCREDPIGRILPDVHICVPESH